jgi:hypothetical protein
LNERDFHEGVGGPDALQTWADECSMADLVEYSFITD